MPNLLLGLDIDRVDLCKEGANSEAHILLYKRKETEAPMTYEEVLAKLKPEHAEIIKQAMDEATEELTKSLETVTSEKEEEKDEETEEDMFKSMTPAAQEIFKSMQAKVAAAEEIAKQAKEKEDNDKAIAKAKEIAALPVEEDKLVEMMKSVSDEVFEILKTASKLVEESELLKEKGQATGANQSTDAWDAILTKAKKIQEKDGTTIEKAVSQVMNDEPELYQKYIEEKEVV